jgi:hypothetical protein
MIKPLFSCPFFLRGEHCERLISWGDFEIYHRIVHRILFVFCEVISDRRFSLVAAFLCLWSGFFASEREFHWFISVSRQGLYEGTNRQYCLVWIWVICGWHNIYLLICKYIYNTFCVSTFWHIPIFCNSWTWKW